MLGRGRRWERRRRSRRCEGSSPGSERFWFHWRFWEDRLSSISHFALQLVNKEYHYSNNNLYMRYTQPFPLYSPPPTSPLYLLIIPPPLPTRTRRTTRLLALHLTILPRPLILTLHLLPRLAHIRVRRTIIQWIPVLLLTSLLAPLPSQLALVHEGTCLFVRLLLLRLWVGVVRVVGFVFLGDFGAGAGLRFFGGVGLDVFPEAGSQCWGG